MDKNVLTDYLVRNQKEMYQWAYNLTLDYENARDLLQSTMLKILAACHAYREEINLDGWVYTVMRNLYFNEYNRAVRQCRLPDDQWARIENFSFDFLSAESSDASCDVREIHEAVEALHETYKIPFSLYLSGYKYHEIARKIGIPIGTVKSRIYVGRQQLQLTLKDFKE